MLDAHAYARQLKPLLGQSGAYARSLLRSRDDAEDAVQQAALRAWERIEQYDATRPFKGWWFAILRNCCFDILRCVNASKTNSLEGVDPSDCTEVEIFDWESLEAGLGKISPDHQEILRLKYYGSLSYGELAEALGIPKGTVMSRLYLARKALAAMIRREAA